MRVFSSFFSSFFLQIEHSSKRVFHDDVHVYLLCFWYTCTLKVKRYGMVCMYVVVLCVILCVVGVATFEATKEYSHVHQ